MTEQKEVFNQLISSVKYYSNLAEKLEQGISTLNMLLNSQTCEAGLQLEDFSGSLYKEPDTKADLLAISDEPLCILWSVTIGRTTWLLVQMGTIQGWIDVEETDVDLTSIPLESSNEEINALYASLEEYGLKVEISAFGDMYRPAILEADAKLLAEALDIAEELKSFGISFSLEGIWTVEELRILRDTIVEIAQSLANVEPIETDLTDEDIQLLFKQIYGETEIVRQNTVLYNNRRAFNDGENRIFLSNSAFYRYEKNDFIATLETMPGISRGSPLTYFTSPVIIGHEFHHNIQMRLQTQIIDNIGSTLQQYWYNQLAIGKYSLIRSYTVNCLSDNKLITKTFGIGTTFNFTAASTNEGFAYTAHSLVDDAETVTDALNALMLNLYTIGPNYSCEQNLAGLARKEQSEALWAIVFSQFIAN